MIAVLFEVTSADDQQIEYMDIAEEISSELDGIDGFISVERFESLSTPGKILSLSFWHDDTTAWYDPATAESWQALGRHRKSTDGHAQPAGRREDYRLRIASIVRDYTMDEHG